MLPVLTPEQSNAWDKRSISAGIDVATLMESAGRAVATVLVSRYSHPLRNGVLVAAGPGNNGGDGWVVARALHRLEIPVWVTSSGSGTELRERMAGVARAEGVREVAPDGPWPSAAVVVDALLGTGATGTPRPAIAALLARLLDLEVPVVAIDGPTGIDLLTGMVHGPTRADLTVTFGGFRRGHLLARDEVGDLVVVDIGHAPPDPAWPAVVTDTEAAEWLPRLKAVAHKGDRGRLVVIGGDAGMTGAIRMSARAAFGSGAGLVHVVAPSETVASLVQAEPDVQTLAQAFDQPASAALLQLIERSDAVVIGPGLGRQSARREFVLAILEVARKVVLDADALVVLAGAVGQLRKLAATRAFVLTPHPGEFRALFHDLAATRELDPWAAASAACDQAGSTILLKGVPTVITSPGKPTRTVVAGNPGLATGGSGDILSGVIGAALAAGVEPDLAAALGAQVLGRAADIGARRHTARSLRPMDVVNAFPDLWRAWEVVRLARPTPRPPILFELPRPQTT